MPLCNKTATHFVTPLAHPFRMIKVGLTGGIGSGKTTVAQVFATIGVSVYNCDNAAHDLMDSDARIVTALKNRYGADIYGADGRLNRKALASIIFNNKDELAFVNGTVHPVVADDFLRWADTLAAKGEAWCVCESAILSESGLARIMDKVIAVYLPLEMRIARTMVRDNATREKVLERIANQAPAEDVAKMADYVISPDDRHLIMPQIIAIDAELRAQ